MTHSLTEAQLKELRTALGLAAGYIHDAYRLCRIAEENTTIGHLVAKLVDHVDDAIDVLEGREPWRTR